MFKLAECEMGARKQLTYWSQNRPTDSANRIQCDNIRHLDRLEYLHQRGASNADGRASNQTAKKAQGQNHV